MAKMLGWLSAPTTRASCSKRRSRSVSWANDGGKVFTATSRRKRASRARYTSPIPPAPKRDKISYGPSLVPETSAMDRGNNIIEPRKAAVGAYGGWTIDSRVSSGNVPHLRRARSEANYNATRFLHMLYEHRGLETARILLHSTNFHKCLRRLYGPVGMR